MSYLLFSYLNLDDRGGVTLRNVAELQPDYRTIPEDDILNTGLFNCSKKLQFVTNVTEYERLNNILVKTRFRDATIRLIERNIRQVMVAASRGSNSASKMDRPYKGNLSSQASEILGCNSHIRGPNSEANKVKADVLKIPRGDKFLGTIIL
jgi:hypothetical protein